jgi:hypothetical protein
LKHAGRGKVTIIVLLAQYWVIQKLSKAWGGGLLITGSILKIAKSVTSQNKDNIDTCENRQKSNAFIVYYMKLSYNNVFIRTYRHTNKETKNAIKRHIFWKHSSWYWLPMCLQWAMNQDWTLWNTAWS